MGDSALIMIKQAGQTAKNSVYICLSAHWKGPHVAIDLREGLNRGRWSQPNFLAKNIFCEMVRGMEDDDSRFGLFASVVDDSSQNASSDDSDQEDSGVDRPMIKVDPTAETVTIYGYTALTFNEYIFLTDEELLTRMGGCHSAPDCSFCKQRRAFYEQYPYKEDVGIYHKAPFTKLHNPGRRVRISQRPSPSQ